MQIAKIIYLFNYHFNLPNIYIYLERKHLEIVSNKVHECDRHLHILLGIYDRLDFFFFQNYYQMHYYLDQKYIRFIQI